MLEAEADAEVRVIVLTAPAADFVRARTCRCSAASPSRASDRMATDHALRNCGNGAERTQCPRRIFKRSIRISLPCRSR